MFGVPVGTTAQASIIVVTTAIFIASAVSGVERGVKWLSIGNLVLAALLALVVFVLGPTVAIVNTFTNTLSAYLSEFVRTSLRMSPFRNSSRVDDWTIFYWAWWVSWSPFVGLFIARVSRGRTIRQFLVGTVLAPTLVGFMWFAIFGGAAVQSDAATAMFAMFNALPMGTAMSVVATVLVVVFFVTSGDSATLVLGMMSTGGDPDPRAWIKVAWGMLVAAIVLSLRFAGGLQAVQTATIVFALPFAFVLVLMAVALLLAVRQDWDDEQRREKALRKKMRALVEPKA